MIRFYFRSHRCKYKSVYIHFTKSQFPTELRRKTYQLFNVAKQKKNLLHGKVVGFEHTSFFFSFKQHLLNRSQCYFIWFWIWYIVYYFILAIAFAMDHFRYGISLNFDLFVSLVRMWCQIYIAHLFNWRISMKFPTKLNHIFQAKIWTEFCFSRFMERFQWTSSAHRFHGNMQFYWNFHTKRTEIHSNKVIKMNMLTMMHYKLMNFWNKMLNVSNPSKTGSSWEKISIKGGKLIFQ